MTVLPAIGPIRELFARELEPQISDTSTSGTTNNLSEATKIRPTASNSPETIYVSNADRTDSGKAVLCNATLNRHPSTIPATIAIKIRLVRLIRGTVRCHNPTPPRSSRRCKVKRIPCAHPPPARRTLAHTAWCTPTAGGRHKG